MTQKGLAPILIVILIAAVIGGYLVYSGKIYLNPTENSINQIIQNSPLITAPGEVASWKAYAESGYVLKYPDNWELKDWTLKGSRAPGMEIRIRPPLKPQVQYNEFYSIEIYKYDSQVDFCGSSVPGELLTKEGTVDWKSVITRDIQVSGSNVAFYLSPIKFNNNTPPDYLGKLESKPILHNGKFYCFILNYFKMTDQNNINQDSLKPLTTILSTFKFLDSEKDNSPGEVANNFYQWYLDCLNTGPTQNCSYTKSKYVHQKLIDQFNKYEEDFRRSCGNSENCSHGDLILCAQNTPQSIYTDKAEVSGNIAKTTVHTIYTGSGDNPIKVTLEKNTANWQITNIECKKP